MKKKDAIEKFSEGALMVVAEYRGTVAEVITYRDKLTVKTLTDPICYNAVEGGSHQIKLNERLPDGADVKALKVPFKKGQKVLMYLSGLSRNKGQLSADGTLEALEE